MNNLSEGIQGYEDIYKLSCREANCSWKPKMLHPHLKLREGLPRVADQSSDKADTDRRLTEGDTEKTPSPPGQSPFEQLPPQLKLKILALTLVSPNKVVHAISRLDPFTARPTCTDCTGRTPVLFHRFHIGRRAVSVNSAIEPNAHLAILLVTKEFHYIGSELFYGGNNFAFSSLGE